MSFVLKPATKIRIAHPSRNSNNTGHISHYSLQERLMVVNEKAKSGLRISTWSDLSSLVALIGIFIATLGFGFNLKSGQDVTNTRLSVIVAQLSVGMLPRSQERLDAQRKDIDRLEAELRRHIESGK